jgi:stress-induced morphogen
MGMQPDEIETHIRDAFPDAVFRLVDLAGDANHYELTIEAEAFRGLSRIAQHQLVYAALKGHMGGTLHALALKTRSPA